MIVAFDLDGLIDSFPREFQTMMSALKAAAHRVVIITGVASSTVTDEDVDQKRQYLTGLGISRDVYDDLIVCPPPHPQNKVQAIIDNEVALLFENSVANVKAALPYCAALLLYNSKQKK